ncbi:MAG: sensor domain-containing diguanylate cyclase [candidate division Zixibacteria bacterium]|nr:sensor domain-containing diguanylate cyclase [candidate division Zixibacteria bacterium]
MVLFLDKHKTLLPRIDSIYLLTRIMALVGIAWFAYNGTYPDSDQLFFQIVLGTFVAHLALFYAAVKGKFDLKLAYLSAISYDLILIPLLVLYSGDIHSPFYLMLFLTISVAAYVLTFWFASFVTLLAVTGYVLAVSQNLISESFFDLSIRLGFIVVFFLAISYASQYMRRSEKRMLKLFNTLNKRTSELEKSQAELEMIYENTRALASILDTDGVVKEVVKLIGDVLQYDCFTLVFQDKWHNFYHRARVQEGRRNFHLKAIDEQGTELIQKVSDLGEAVTVKDIINRSDYQPLSEGSRSVILLPMVSHGKNNGVLIVEAETPERFRERDVQMLSVVARSAALALENAELHKRTEELTVIDELTETYNYRYFVKKLEEEKRRAIRYNLPLSLVMVDIDWFKQFNDTYGHETGNVVLRSLSATIKQCIRDVDIFTRYGGEEFAVILPQTPLVEASSIGERIRAQVEIMEVNAGPAGKLRVTVSVGVSSFPENGKSHEELVSVTDQALYRAKGEGRNLVRII